MNGRRDFWTAGRCAVALFLLLLGSGPAARAVDPGDDGPPPKPASSTPPRTASAPATESEPASPPAYQSIVTASMPLHGSALPWDRVPANVQTASGAEIARNHEPALSDFLNTSLGSVHLNDVQGNPLQPDLQFRGFTASPILGVQQGLSVYVDGMRANEAFGDTVNWDLFPSAAIGSINLMPGSNPVFGLNTLGGALSIETKTGFSSPSAAAHLSAGSFGRRRLEFQQGDNAGRFGYFAAGSLFQEDGWREFSPSEAKSVFGDLMYAGEKTKANLSLFGADTALYGNSVTPVGLLATDRRAIFTYPDITQNHLFAAILRGDRLLSPSVHLSALAFYRRNHTATVNGDQADFPRCADDQGRDAVCATNDDGTVAPIKDRAGNTVPYDATNPYDGAENQTDTRQQSYGVSAQLAVETPLGDRENHFFAGVSAHQARIHFQSQSVLARRTPDRGVLTAGIVDGDEDVAVDSTVSNLGVYLSDTVALASHLFLTIAGRYNVSTLVLTDRLGDALSGDHRFQRPNPSVGASYQPWAALGAYVSYNESARTPTALELTCASPDAPCRLPNAFVTDPPLSQVVVRTVEGGVRGRMVRARSAIEYDAGLFRTVNSDDILFVSDGPLTNQGYFKNVGLTRRQGIEVGLKAHYRAAGREVRVEGSVHYTLLDATFRTAFLANSPNNPLAEMGEISVQPGSRLPGMPRHIVKGTVGLVLADRWQLAVDVLGTSGIFYRGDEANLLGQIPGYVIANVRASVDVVTAVSIFVKVSNLTDAHYATFGALGSPSEVLGPTFSDPRFQTPGAPRAAWVGLDLRY
ncbi:MAG TPA: TonB-dependent receptor [Polyangia bacterium]|nr:TonB-dependent receptor [Polyangia bacterium]